MENLGIQMGCWNWKLIGVKRITRACMTSNVAIGEKSSGSTDPPCGSLMPKRGLRCATRRPALRTYSSQIVIGEIKDGLGEQFAVSHPST